MGRAGAPNPPQTWFECGAGRVTIEIVARPGVSTRRIVRLDPRGLVVTLNAAPEKGKANDELINFLAREIKIPKSAIAIVRGATSRRKTVRIEPCDPAAIAARLDALIRAVS
jgi:uncharacterized protein